MAEKFIYWLEEVGVQDNELVGKKCANLGELTKAGVRVPPGFALSLQAYEQFLKRTGALEEMREFLKTFSADPDDVEKYQKATEILRSIVDAKAMPEDMEEVIASYYDALCQKVGIADVAVAVRSAGPVSRPGQYETYLNVVGKSDLMRKIIRVWSSTFNHRSLVWRAQNGYPLEFDPIGVAVIKMVNAKAAGVMFTLNPANGDLSKIAIEANWGLGESVVSGSVSPDFYLVDKATFEIVERKIAQKTLEYAKDEATGETKYLEIPPERQNAPCLTDDEIRELARQGKFIEQYYGKPQDTEWAVDKDLPFPNNIIFLQARPETVWSKKKAEPVFTPGKGVLEYIVDTIREGKKLA